MCRWLGMRSRCFWRPHFHWKTIIKLLLISAILFILYKGAIYLIFTTGLYRQTEPGAVKGYFHCDVGTESLKNFSRKYPCDFNPQPNSKGPIIVTFINNAWLSLAQNWVCSAKKVGITDNIYLISFEHGVCLNFPGIRCYEHPHITVQGTTFGKPAYRTLVIERTKVILQLLSCYKTVGLVDADITFLQNPLSYLESIMTNKDIVFQADSVGVGFVDPLLPYFFSYICGGFMYMKSNYATKRLWLSVLQYQKNFFWNDQAGLNICIRHHNQDVSWTTLDSKYFPNGRQFFFYEESSKEALIVHANHLQGLEKQLRMVGAGVWCSEEHAKSMCTSGHIFKARCSSGRGSQPTYWCKRFTSACQRQFGIQVSV